jgi:hypothetical protein
MCARQPTGGEHTATLGPAPYAKKEYAGEVDAEGGVESAAVVVGLHPAAVNSNDAFGSHMPPAAEADVDDMRW